MTKSKKKAKKKHTKLKKSSARIQSLGNDHGSIGDYIGRAFVKGRMGDV